MEYPGAYPHGYAYQVWVVALSSLTGVAVADLLQLYLPVVGSLFLALFGFAAYRRLLASDRLAALAAAVLFLVPELVFSVSRGNHEKLTVSLTLLALLALLNSFLEMMQARRWGVFAGWVAVYYLTAFTLVTLNALFGSSFIVASTLTLAFALILVKPNPQGGKLSPVVQRLVLVVGTSWLLVMLVMFYVYPPAGDNLNLLTTTLQKLSALFLTFTPGADPYLVVYDWASRGVFHLVSSFRWVLFVTSFLTWLLLLWHALKRLDQTPLHRLLLIALYGAFSLQVALAIPVDFLGLAAGTNLQVRMYTYFSVVAAPMFALGLVRLVEWLKPGFMRDAVVTGVGLLLVGFVFLSLLKATLDPALSNRWLFYHPAEVAALRFWDVQQEGDSLWIGPEGRVIFAYWLEFPQTLPNNNRFISSESDDLSFTSALSSRLLIENSIAWRTRVPVTMNEQRVYDNGEALIFHRIPRTPFQR